MIPISFNYTRAASVEEALSALASGDAKVLSGGQSLLPAMKLRLNAPDLLVDIAKIPALQGISQEGNELVIGAAATHAQIASSDLVKSTVSILAEGAAVIGDPSIRNKGTLGGSLAHADPAADWPALVLATEATIVCQGAGGKRSVAAADFFTGMYSTALEEGEIITQVRFPISAGAKMSYQKFVQPASRFAIVGCAVVRHANGATKVAFSGVSDNPFADAGVETAISGQPLDEAHIAAAASQAANGQDIMSDHYASVAYRHHLARVYCKRALMAVA